MSKSPPIALKSTNPELWDKLRKEYNAKRVREWRHKDPEGYRKKHNAYRAKHANTEKTKEKHRKRYWNNREKLLEKNRLWRLANPDYPKKHARHQHKLRRIFLENLAGRPCPSNCEVCGNPPNINPPIRRSLSFDHDHITGKFRGWLCQRCNMALGLVRDNPELLYSLAAYLNAHMGEIVQDPMLLDHNPLIETPRSNKALNRDS